MKGVKNLRATIGHFLNQAPGRKPPASCRGDTIL